LLYNLLPHASHTRRDKREDRKIGSFNCYSQEEEKKTMGNRETIKEEKKERSDANAHFVLEIMGHIKPRSIGVGDGVRGSWRYFT
jgi:hypothetical protein